MAFGDADLATFTADFGVVVGYGSQPSAHGIFDAPQKTLGADSGFGGVDTSIPAVTVAFNAFDPMPEQEETISVDGQDYLIGAVTAEGDGRFVRIELKAAD